MSVIFAVVLAASSPSTSVCAARAATVEQAVRSAVVTKHEVATLLEVGNTRSQHGKDAVPIDWLCPSIASSSARLSTDPATRKILARNQVSARRVVVAAFAMWRAAHQDDAKAGNRQNIRLYRVNKSELDRLINPSK